MYHIHLFDIMSDIPLLFFVYKLSTDKAKSMWMALALSRHYKYLHLKVSAFESFENTADESGLSHSQFAKLFLQLIGLCVYVEVVKTPPFNRNCC